MEALKRGLTAQRIWQDLRTDHGFAESYQSVQRFVRRLRTARPLPFRRMECEPGAEAQIDFGTGAVIVPVDLSQPNGKTRRRKTHVLRVLLSHSRKAYSEVVYRQTTEEFIRCIENAFHHFGARPRRWSSTT
ncbi:MAG: transposase [Planctomycetia bacterium]|nr:MAG: transposase [Planctomycetia bacterium]